MKNTRIGAAAMVLTIATTLTACQGLRLTSSSTTSTSGAASTAPSHAGAAANNATPSSSGTSGTSSSASPRSTAQPSQGPDASGEHNPTGARPDAPENISVPQSGILNSAQVVMAGGYRSEPSSHYAKLDSVWKVEGSAPGVATIIRHRRLSRQEQGGEQGGLHQHRERARHDEGLDDPR